MQIKKRVASLMVMLTLIMPAHVAVSTVPAVEKHHKTEAKPSLVMCDSVVT
jgi:hypothetical protein